MFSAVHRQKRDGHERTSEIAINVNIFFGTSELPLKWWNVFIYISFFTVGPFQSKICRDSESGTLFNTETFLRPNWVTSTSPNNTMLPTSISLWTYHSRLSGGGISKSKTLKQKSQSPILHTLETSYYAHCRRFSSLLCVSWIGSCASLIPRAVHETK